MFKHLEGAKLGIFIFIGTVLMVISIFLIGNKDSLFVSSIYIKTHFPTIEGLKSGASVRFSGMDIGAVSSITLIPEEEDRVEVTMRIEEEVVQFIRIDSEASIETEGVIGKKIVSISPGSPDLEAIRDGGTIRSKAPISMTEIIEETQGAISYMKEITKDFSEIVSKINKGDGTIGKIVNDDELYYSTVNIIQSSDTSLKAITKRLDQVSTFIIGLGDGVENILLNVETATKDISNLVQSIEKGEGVLGALISDRSSYDSIKTVINNLVLITESALSGTQGFAENMEALKHNWLFKSYFEERGYWDTAEYEKNLDMKLNEIKLQNQLLQQKLEELKKLDSALNTGPE